MHWIIKLQTQTDTWDWNCAPHPVLRAFTNGLQSLRHKAWSHVFLLSEPSAAFPTVEQSHHCPQLPITSMGIPLGLQLPIFQPSSPKQAGRCAPPPPTTKKHNTIPSGYFESKCETLTSTASGMKASAESWSKHPEGGVTSQKGSTTRIVHHQTSSCLHCLERHSHRRAALASGRASLRSFWRAAMTSLLHGGRRH